MVTAVQLTSSLAGASAFNLHGGSTSSTRALSRFDGLAGPSAPRDVVRTRSQAHGSIDATAYVDARTITLEGELWGATAGAALADLSTISETLMASLLSPIKLTVTWDDGTVRWCNVKLASAIDTSATGANKVVGYQVQLRASDPRWYSTTLKTATVQCSSSTTVVTASATNSGTAPSPMTIVATANTSGSAATQKLVLSTMDVTLPTAYSGLVPSSNSPAGTQSILSAYAGGVTSLSPTPYIEVLQGTPRTWYSATRTGTDMTNVWGTSEFPFAYPGTQTCSATHASNAGMTGATVVYSWYDAWW